MIEGRFGFWLGEGEWGMGDGGEVWYVIFLFSPQYIYIYIF